MTINLKGLATLLFAATCCFLIVLRAVAQTPARRTQPLAVIKYEGNMTALLSHLPEVFGVTIGLELDPKQPEPQVSFYLRDPTISDVLNAIVASAPRYKWSESDGFINLMSVEASSQLLDTRIRRFQANLVDETEAIDQLLNLAEVKSNMSAIGLNRREVHNASRGRKTAKFSVNLEDVTIRQALNRIATENGTRFWIFRKLDNGFFSISGEP